MADTAVAHTVRVMTTETTPTYTDPADEAPWAMQVLVRIDKAAPPSHTATLESVASAVAVSIASFEVGDEGEQAALARWRAGRIRKIVRRVTKPTWWDAADLPGSVLVPAPADGVDVRVFAPAPVDQVPGPVARTQVSGLDLPDAGEAATERDDPFGVRIYLTPSVRLSTGKAAAQVAHAAQLVLEQSRALPASAGWVAAGCPVTVRQASVDLWSAPRPHGSVSITDAGFTEIPAGTQTCFAVHTLHHD